MQHEKWQCPKCRNDEFDVDKFAATGGFFSKIFDVQNKKFTTVSCTRCRYTEIYKADTSMLGNIFDFFVGS
jgi:predicted nucleic-acid-binding Zn-ribbon protein